MFTKFQKSFQTGVVTSSYPRKDEITPLRFRGRIEIDNEKCKQCNACVEVCPTDAYTWIEEKGKPIPATIPCQMCFLRDVRRGVSV